VNSELGIEDNNASFDGTFLDSVEEWGKKEKQHKHLQPKCYRPFKEHRVKMTGNVMEMIDSAVTIDLTIDDNCVSIEHDDTRKTYFSTPGSHRSPLNGEPSCQIELYRNRLPKDLTYYRNVKMTNTNNYVVGTYGYLSDEFIFKDVVIRDFHTLSEGNWLSNFVIDICLALKVYELRLNNVKILPCEVVVRVMEKTDIGESKRRTIEIKENSIVVLPWNICNSHWIIAIVDFNRKECMIMDPFTPKDIDSRVCASRFKKLITRMKDNCIYGLGKEFPLLKLIQCPMENIPVQTDGYNCGVFIIYYMFTIISKLNFDPQFNPNEYRFYLKQYLLEKSENMFNVCLYCNRSSNAHRCEEGQNQVDWVSCTRCGRWIALNCIPKEDRLENYESIVFLCVLCQ
jgi:Ulp1 protease family, C-terminal catalytic domain